MSTASSGSPERDDGHESTRNRAASLRESILSSSTHETVSAESPSPRSAPGWKHALLSVCRRKLPELTALLVLILFLIGTIVISENRKQLHIQQVRTLTGFRVSQLSLSIRNAIERRASLLSGLFAWIQLHPDQNILRSEFGLYASSLRGKDPAVLAIQAFPSQGVNYLYSADGDSALPGKTLADLMADGFRIFPEDISRALDAQSTIISEPYLVREGVEGIVLLRSIRVGESLWGLCSILLDLDVLLQNVGFGVDTPDLSLSLYDSHGRIFSGLRVPSGIDPVSAKIPFPGDEWTLAAYPTGGWIHEVAPQYRLYLLAGITISLLAAILVYILVKSYSSISSSLTESEKERVSNEVKLDLAVKGSRIGFFEYDSKTGSVKRSAEYEMQLGYEPGTMAVEATFWDTLVHPDDRQHALKVSTDCLAGKNSEYELQYRIRHRDSSWHWILGRGIARIDRNGVVLGLVGCHIDITELKTSEETLRSMFQEADRSRDALMGILEDQRILELKIRALNAELEDRVRERTAALELSNRDLVTAYRELESFSYSVSHDLRTPLRAMSGFAELLESGYAHLLDDRALHYIRRIREAAVMMGQLISDMLELARVTRAPLEKSGLDMTAIATRICVALKERNPERSVQCSIQEGMRASGDSRLMEIALGNLLDNAWKFTAKVQDAVITVFATQKVAEDGSASVVFTVADNGAGFDMSYVEKLFQPFQRLHRSTDFPGTGIGLVIVQRIIHRHGGWISAHGEPGKGATFEFQLPLQD